MQKQIACAAAAAMLVFAPGAGAADYAIQNLTALHGGDFDWRLLNNSGELAGSVDDVLYLQLTSGRVAYRLGADVYLMRPTVLANDGTTYFSITTNDGISRFGGIRRNGVAFGIPSLPDSPPGHSSIVEAVNDHGVAAGYGAPANGLIHAAIFRDGQAIDIGGSLGNGGSYATSINNGGVVGGVLYDTFTGTSEGFIHANGHVTLTGANTSVQRINDANLVAGERIASDAAGSYTSIFLYQDGVSTDIGVAGMRDTEVVDLNNANQLLGKATDSGHNVQYFLYAGGETVMLDDVLAAHGYAGWGVNTAYDINDKGQILLDAYGYVDNRYVEKSLLLSPVPEPGTWAMLLGGLACMGMLKRRRATCA